MVGGPGIIVHRSHEKEKTKIRVKEMEEQGKETKTSENCMILCKYAVSVGNHAANGNRIFY